MADLSFHHFFVFVPPGAKQVDRLVQAGFLEASRNTHAGQGTANRRIFFDNGMLEFIWASDLTELRTPLTAPTRLLERSQSRTSGFSPFGICVTSATPKPFAGWDYRPRYLPAELRLWQAANEGQPWEPQIFELGGESLARLEGARTEPRKHPNGAHRIARITVTVAAPDTAPVSEAARAIAALPMLAWVSGKDPHATIEIETNGHAAVIDLTPACPVRVVLARS